jgi:hypothetical protein
MVQSRFPPPPTAAAALFPNHSIAKCDNSRQPPTKNGFARTHARTQGAHEVSKLQSLLAIGTRKTVPPTGDLRFSSRHNVN